MNRERYGRRLIVLGRCYDCRRPVRVGENPAKLFDRAAGVERLAHGGSCADRVERLLTAGRGGDAIERR